MEKKAKDRKRRRHRGETEKWDGIQEATESEGKIRKRGSREEEEEEEEAGGRGERGGKSVP